MPKIFKIYDPLLSDVKTYLVKENTIKFGNEENCDVNITLPHLNELTMTLDMDNDTITLEKFDDNQKIVQHVCDLAKNVIFRIHTIFMFYMDIAEEDVKDLQNNKVMREKDNEIIENAINKERQGKKHLQYVDKKGHKISFDLKKCVRKNIDLDGNTSVTNTTEHNNSVENSDDGKTSEKENTNEGESETVKESEKIEKKEDKGEEVVKKFKKSSSKAKKTKEQSKCRKERSGRCCCVRNKTRGKRC